MGIDWPTYIVAGFALAADAFAVSVSSGICVKELKVAYALRAAAFFGGFQFAMPVAGFYLGSAFSGLVEAVDHWIAFGLLVAIGGRMLYESFKVEKELSCDTDKPAGILRLRTLTALAVATSVDAFAVGISYAFIAAPIWIAAALIGVITFALSLLGCEAGKRLGAKFEKGAEIAGGLALVGIGAKILIEHLLRA
jgi:putative Mn2+ efflux pump MntP